MPIKKSTQKIILSRAIGWAICIGVYILGATNGWQLYKHLNEYMGYTSGIGFWEMGIDGFVDFFNDFNSPNLKIALLGTLFAGIAGIIKAFRSRK